MPHHTVTPCPELAPQWHGRPFTWHHMLYRLYDGYGRLQYVGRTSNIARRLQEHRHQQRWWSDVEDVTITFYPTLTELIDAERKAIVIEESYWNVAGASAFAIRWQEWNVLCDLAEANGTQYPPRYPGDTEVNWPEGVVPPVSVPEPA